MMEWHKLMYTYYYKTKFETVCVHVTLRACIRKVHGPNLRPDPGYLDLRVSWFSSAYQVKFLDSHSINPQLPPFIIHPASRSLIVSVVTASFNQPQEVNAFLSQDEQLLWDLRFSCWPLLNTRISYYLLRRDTVHSGLYITTFRIYLQHLSSGKYHEDGGRKFLRNISTYLSVCTTSHPSIC
jgi:hypothetical protein